MRWESEFEPARKAAPSGGDKEVTLGPVLLTALGLGLIAVCCVCFLAGYSIGHRSAGAAGLKMPAAVSAGPSAVQLLEQSKPAAAQNNMPAQPAATQGPQSASAQTAAMPTTAASTPQLQPAVQTITPAQYSPAQQAPAANPLVHPALAQTLPQNVSQNVPWIVQIAAVEHAADAGVLMDALRRRGYAVSVRQDAMDKLFHVFVGPFAGRSQADSMQARLQSDGYNAVLLP